MAKNILGIDIGYDSLKLALVNGSQVRKTVRVPMPTKLLQDGRVISTETMGELIRNTLKKSGLRANYAALSLTGESVFTRTLTVPQMTADQLKYNIAYEFRDYITTELKECVFDYAMISTPEELRVQKAVDEEGNPVSPTMDILAVAAPSALIEDAKSMLRKAGLRLATAAPSECAYIALIREAEKRGAARDREYCIIDLGFNAIRMHMFKGERHMVTRQLETGLSTVDEVVADAYNVDVHLAHTYLTTNHDGCQNKDFCVSTFGNMSVELMRAVNFYRFNNPDSMLSDVWLCGGGVAIPSLCRSISESLGMNIHFAGELIPGGDRIEECYEFVQAIGIAQY